jgi:hypothetical protein
MKVKTSELTGHALDWAVAKCEEPRDNRLTVIRHEDYIGHPIERETEPQSYTYVWWSPSRIWAQGGPIIERERISVGDQTHIEGQPTDSACYATNRKGAYGLGPKPLTAAMRCYVASKLGDTVDVPEELSK